MPSVNAGEHKERFDQLKPDDATQAEFVSDLLDAYELVDDEGIDMNEIMERIDLRLGTQVELAAFRGAREAIENYDD